VRESGFAVQPFGVVAGGDEQGGGAVGAHPEELEQLRGLMVMISDQLAVDPADGLFQSDW